MKAVVTRVDEMLEIDRRHPPPVLGGEMKRVFFAMRNTQLENLDDELMGYFLAGMDGVDKVLHRIEKRRMERRKQVEQI